MNSRRLSALGLFIAFAWSLAFSDDLKPLRDLGKKAIAAFQQHQEEDARRYFEDFLQQAKNKPGAIRDPQIELTMGALGCAFPEHRALGVAALKHLLQTGKDVGQGRVAVEKLLNSCSGLASVDLPAAATLDQVLVSASSGAPGVSGITKGGDPFMRPVASVSVSTIDPSEMDKRLQETANPATALAPTLARYGGTTDGVVTEHFIVASDGGKKLAQGVAQCLDRYRVDLTKEFAMSFPPHLITVYNTQWEDRVYEVAGRLHGLRLAPGTIAYSVYADLSMVGVGSADMCGTLAHELTHLMIKGNFGDAPAWLEEGLASAVALSVPHGDQLSFQPGWRDRVLRSRWSMRPTVEQLLSLTWADFSPADYAGLNKAAAVQATASVFVRYLAAKNKLHPVYVEFQKQDPMADVDHQQTAQEILEKVLGKSVAEVDQDFAAWFTNQPAPGSQTVKPNTAKKDAPCKPATSESKMAQQQAACEPETKNKAR